MGETTSQIREQVTQARSRLDEDLSALESRVKSTADWRVVFDRHPWAFLGAAFGGGLLISLMTARKRDHEYPELSEPGWILYRPAPGKHIRRAA